MRGEKSNEKKRREEESERDEGARLQKIRKLCFPIPPVDPFDFELSELKSSMKVRR